MLCEAWLRHVVFFVWWMLVCIGMRAIWLGKDALCLPVPLGFPGDGAAFGGTRF